MSLIKNDLVFTSFQISDASSIVVGNPFVSKDIVMGTSTLGATDQGILDVNTTQADANFWYISVFDVTQGIAYYKVALEAP